MGDFEPFSTGTVSRDLHNEQCSALLSETHCDLRKCQSRALSLLFSCVLLCVLTRALCLKFSVAGHGRRFASIHEFKRRIQVKH